jgi:hypothetical protein
MSFPLSIRVVCCAGPRGSGERLLHPAAETGEENDQWAEQECYQDGQVAGSARNAASYGRYPQGTGGDAAGKGQGT